MYSSVGGAVILPDYSFEGSELPLGCFIDYFFDSFEN